MSARFLHDVLAAVSSKEPHAGGACAAALTGAVGASLLTKVARLPRTKSGTPEESAELATAAARLQLIRDRLVALIDEDSGVAAAVPAAMRLGRSTSDEQAARRAAIETALQALTEAPLETMRLCQRALSVAVAVAENSSPNGEADTGTAVELLLAALRSAAMHVDVNLRSVSDELFVTRVRLERQGTQDDAECDAATVMALIAREG